MFLRVLILPMCSISWSRSLGANPCLIYSHPEKWLMLVDVKSIQRRTARHVTMPKPENPAILGNIPGTSDVVPFWVWYGFLVRTLIKATKNVLHWRV